MKKKCTKCKKELNISFFCKDKKATSGFSFWCRMCRTISRMNWFRQNKVKHHKSYNEWYSRNKEMQQKRIREYRQKNAEKIYKSIRIWVKKNKEKVRQYQKNRSALLRGSKGRITSLEWLWLKEKYFYLCLGCYRREPDIKLTQDHCIPISKKGDNKIENIQPLCINCNVKKGTRIIDFRIIREQYYEDKLPLILKSYGFEYQYKK